jgi:hypothetical protein
MQRHKSVDPSSVGVNINDPQGSALFKLRLFQQNSNQSVMKAAYIIFLTTVLTVLIYFTTPAPLPVPAVWLEEHQPADMNVLRFNEGKSFNFSNSY